MVGLNTLVGKRYKILAQIGKGGMSTVYLAIDSSLNKQWAIKEIRSASDPVQRDLVIKSLTVEANMIKRFDHPAIPRIVDLIEEKGSLFVVMDYVEGQTLASLLKKEGPQSEEDVVDWGIQLCDVLDYLHRRKHPVSFRDMKPSNVMLTPEGAIKLIDTIMNARTGYTDFRGIHDMKNIAAVDTRRTVWDTMNIGQHFLAYANATYDTLNTAKVVKPFVNPTADGGLQWKHSPQDYFKTLVPDPDQLWNFKTIYQAPGKLSDGAAEASNAIRVGISDL